MVHSRREEPANARPRRRRLPATDGTVAALLLVVASGLCACGARLDDGLHSTDTGNPPFVDSARITARLDGATVVVQGRPGSVPAGAQVLVSNETRETIAGTSAAPDGSFEVVVAGQGGDELTVSVGVNGETSSATLAAPDAAPSTEATDAGGLSPRDVGWPNVDWHGSYWVELGPNTRTGIGLWMGTGIGDELEAEVFEPPYEVEGEAVAVRFAGESPAQGGDVFFHIALPMETISKAVYFNARSRAGAGQVLRVTLGGPYEKYWSDMADGADWPSWEITLGESWTKHELTFAELGFDAEHLSPYSDPFGALHFLVPAERAYDFEIFDLVLINFLPE